MTQREGEEKGRKRLEGVVVEWEEVQVTEEMIL